MSQPMETKLENASMMAANAIEEAKPKKSLAQKVKGAVIGAVAGVVAVSGNAYAAVLDLATQGKIDTHVASVTTDLGVLSGYAFDLMFIIGAVVVVLGLAHRLLFRK